ncbi:MAG TPA: TIGR03435 family protein [Bryobacteraceae bacterium]|nr:TIGR03435 family protein [Bryobacteraceae bacterium]
MTYRNLLLVILAATSWGDQPTPKFEVAAIRSHPPSAPRAIGNGKAAYVNPSFSVAGRRLTIENASLASLIEFAYDGKFDAISNAPRWAGVESFDIRAEAGGTQTPSRSEFRQMLQALLTDRFRLKFHLDSKSARGYALVIAKNGPKLTKSSPDAESSMRMNSPGHSVEMTVTKWTMDQLAFQLSITPGIAPLTNATGLTGTYDFTLKWAPDQNPDSDPAVPGLFTALEEQLGLKLKPRETSTSTFVIDNVDRPSAN